MSNNTLLPDDFIDLIRPQLPSHLSIDDLIVTCHQPLRFSIRVNTLKNTVDQFKSLMSALGWTFEPIPWCDTGFWVTMPANATAPGKIPEHLLGLFYIQEASSMLPPVALFNQDQTQQLNQFDTVLDLAAAPGSKTTQIAALMQNCGLLVANEYSSSRVKALHSNLTRMGVNNCLISHFDGHVHGDFLENSFDAVLIDAPCSGEGTVRKDPGAFKNWSLAHVKEVSEVQRGLLRSAFMALKPGGELVYSTCALNAIENQATCQYLLDLFGDAVEVISLANLFDNAQAATTSEGYLHIWPQIYNSEGFFIAKFKKLVATDLAKPTKFKNKFPFSPLSQKMLSEVEQHISDFGLQGIKSSNLYQRDGEIWYFPSHVQQLIAKMKFQRLGIKLFELKPKNIQLEHQAAIMFCQSQLALTRDQLIEFLKGRDVSVNNSDKQKGLVYLGYNSRTIGMGKWVGNKIKNKLPRTLVNDVVAK